MAHKVVLSAGAAWTIYELHWMGRRVFKKWMDDVRDEHYLVGRRLRNIGEPERVAAAEEAAGTQDGAQAADGAADGEDEWDDL